MNKTQKGGFGMPFIKDAKDATHQETPSYQEK